MTTFPTLTPAQPGESAETFGLRAFTFLVATRVPVGCIEPDARAAALHFSLLAVTAPDVADSVRRRYHDVRHQLALRAADDAKAQTPAAAEIVAPAPVQPVQGGARVVRPVPPTRPTPPATSAVTGQPLPDAATVAARLAAARVRAVQTAAQAGAL